MSDAWALILIVLIVSAALLAWLLYIAKREASP